MFSDREKVRHDLAPKSFRIGELFARNRLAIRIPQLKVFQRAARDRFAARTDSEHGKSSWIHVNDASGGVIHEQCVCHGSENGCQSRRTFFHDLRERFNFPLCPHLFGNVLNQNREALCRARVAPTNGRDDLAEVPALQAAPDLHRLVHPRLARFGCLSQNPLESGKDFGNSQTDAAAVRRQPSEPGHIIHPRGIRQLEAKLVGRDDRNAERR
jgi:hypothetical protein